MPTTKILLSFDEPGGVRPSDAMGNLEDLTIDDPTEMPVPVAAWTGGGRLFGGAGVSNALYAADREGRDTLLQRDVTVMAILSYVSQGGGEQFLIVGGLNDGTEAENPDYGLSFVAADGTVEVRWFHGAPGPGSLEFAPPGAFAHLGDGKFFLFTATRRWESSSRVVVRYFLGPDMIAECVWIAGLIGGGTTGHTSIGGMKDSGSWVGLWAGAIDDLLVADFEASPEQIRHVWRRLTVHQPAGVAMFAGHAPPGLPWNDNPSNNFGRRVKVAGQALGVGIAAAEELRDQWLPTRAPIDHIPDWEELCGVTAKPRDSLDVRRARVAGYLQREEGFSHPAVKVALEEVLDLASDDIEILEFENEIRDPFDAIAAERWFAEPAAEWSIVSNQLRLAVASGQSVGAAPFHARNCRMSLERGDNGRVFLALKIAAVSAATLPASSGVGLLLYNRASDNYLWFGVYNDAGTLRVAWRKRVATVSSAITFLAVAPAAPLWLRLYTPMDQGTTLGASGQFTAAWSATGPSSGFTTSSLGSTGVTDSLWAAIAATGGVLGGNLQADFDDWLSYCPDGDRSFCWYAYRPPALPGAPDMVGARVLVAKIKPAHTHASAIRSKSLLCDDPELGLCDHGPMGGL